MTVQKKGRGFSRRAEKWLTDTEWSFVDMEAFKSDGQALSQMAVEAIKKDSGRYGGVTVDDVEGHLQWLAHIDQSRIDFRHPPGGLSAAPIDLPTIDLPTWVLSLPGGGRRILHGTLYEEIEEQVREELGIPLSHAFLAPQLPEENKLPRQVVLSAMIGDFELLDVLLSEAPHDFRLDEYPITCLGGTLVEKVCKSGRGSIGPNVEVLEVLASYGMSLDVETNKGQVDSPSPLMLSAHRRWSEGVRFLLDRGVAIDSWIPEWLGEKSEPPARRRTALGSAILGGNPECVRLLLDATSDEEFQRIEKTGDLGLWLDNTQASIENLERILSMRDERRLMKMMSAKGGSPMGQSDMGL